MEPAKKEDNTPAMEWFKLEVVPARHELESLTGLYVNFAEVRANPEEVYIALYQRADNAAEIGEGVYRSSAIPKQVLIMSIPHAKRFAEAILAQVAEPPESRALPPSVEGREK